MNILITADLHLDQWTRAGRDPLTSITTDLGDLDALIIAGDLADDPRRQWPLALSRIAQLISPERVWIIPGNHDYYSGLLDNGVMTADDGVLSEIASQVGVNFAQKRVLTFGKTRLLCCTLWTDFALLGDPISSMAHARMAMLDYDRIRWSGGALLIPEDTVAIHRDHLDWLTQEIAKPWHGQTIVVTHHAPSAAVEGHLSSRSPAFASNLDGWINVHRPGAWFFGHTHRPNSERIHGTSLVNVSLGYPDEVPRGHETKHLLRGLITSGV